MTLASKQAILAAQDWNTKEIDVPHWGTVRIREMSAAEHLEIVEQFGGGQVANADALNFFARLIVTCLVDEQGQPVLTDDDMPALQRKSLKQLQRVANEILEFNGIGDKATEKN